MEVSGQLHALATFPTGKMTRKSTEYWVVLSPKMA